MCSLELAWLANYTMTSDTIQALLHSVVRNNRKEEMTQGAHILYDAYVSAWNFPLPGDTDAEWQRKSLSARRYHRPTPMRVFPETGNAMQDRLLSRRQVRA